jgi:hypothetical protein
LARDIGSILLTGAPQAGAGARPALFDGFNVPAQLAMNTHGQNAELRHVMISVIVARTDELFCLV